LVRHFYLTIRERVNLILDQEIIVVVRLVIEEGCLDLGACRVNQFNVQQTAVTSLVFPSLFLVFFRDTSFNFPIKKKSV
jgi:hypothetical protein